MEREQSFFLRVIRDHINGRTTEVRGKLDFVEVGDYVMRHQMGPVFYYQTKIPLFRDSYYSQLMLYDYRCSVMEELEKRLEGIPHFIVKGMFIAQYYPVKELRTMNDTDIVVHPEDKEKADKILQDFGFELTLTTSGEWEYSYQGVLVELHTALLYKYSEPTFDEKFFDYFNNCWEHYRDGELDFNFHILFLFIHLRKHIMETGVGFRQFLDLAMITKYAEVDWDAIMAEARKLDLEPFIRTVTAFIERWFGVKSPFGPFALDEEFFDTATETVFKDGIFGFSNYENEYNTVINNYKKTGHRFNRVNVFFKHLFWPYDKMIEIQEFKWLKGKKFLLPLAWTERAAAKLQRWKELKNRYYTTSKTVNKRYEYLEKWGIRGEESTDEGRVED